MVLWLERALAVTQKRSIETFAGFFLLFIIFCFRLHFFYSFEFLQTLFSVLHSTFVVNGFVYLLLLLFLFVHL